MGKNRTGALYVVATPIGNLKDITFRAVEVLKSVNLVAAEDTRRTLKLLNHLQIATRITSYHDHNKETKAPSLILMLEGGKDIAIVSDAGTPGIADPGFYLVRMAVERGIPVVPIPGPSAPIASLSASGLPTDRFVFEGFLPKRKGKRLERLRALSEEERTIIIYESPHRIKQSLEEVLAVMGNRRAAVARELTKLHEEFTRGTIQEVIEKMDKMTAVRGEITILIEGVKEKRRGGKTPIEPGGPR